MNSKWQISRVGLIDFWYYDEEEFDFLDGRMLLRGANGSGKSVTMQSFIPLLLDGNMRPERLDPFGSRARKMENYLLEEGDEREERTGYLYMEFQRPESGEYLTLGMGIRARKNKKLESWYFCVTDGRRVGKDFYLYKDMGNKITCSKTELKNRIGEGGKLMETQGEYIQCVNRLLFGFETQEEYKELLELLIQLRTPKLSKDFKPTVINEILSGSLQTLSEEDLRPMSEAIENMDGLKTNLDSLNESIRAAKQIERVYDQYNQIVLYDKAFWFTEAAMAYADCGKEAKELGERLTGCVEHLNQEQQRYEDLRREEEILKEKKKSLDQSDAARLKEQEAELLRSHKEEQSELENKQRQEQDKREKQIETERRIREKTAENERVWGEIEDRLEEMESEMEDVPFDEFLFMKKELCEENEKPYSFQAHRQLLNAYIKKVENGRELLVEEQSRQERYDRCLQELDERREARNQAERDVQQYGELFRETKSELTEQVYLWNKENQELRLPPETLGSISRKIEEYELGKDASEIKELAKPERDQQERALSGEKLLLEQELKTEAESLKEMEAELEDWKNRKDPEPETPDCVRENRRLLKERGIPYLQFYRTVDFADGLDAQKADRLEEALLSMGVLDALLIPAEYREAVYQLDEGVCDRYIFGDAAHVSRSLMEILEVDNEEQDILFYQNVSNVLSSLGYGAPEDERGGSWIDGNGNYRLGILEGTVTKRYTARFIGARARERYRMEKIEELAKACREQKEIVSGLEERLERNESRSEMLWAEWNAFPKDEDLKTAAKEFSDREHALELRSRELGEKQEQTEAERRALDETGIRVREACAGCYLIPRLDVFVRAAESLRQYQDSLAELQISHEKYLNGIREAAGQKEYAEELEADLDDIRYERNRIYQKVKDLEARILSVQEQLKLTDYEAVRARLDHCIMRLEKLPKEREDSVGRQTDLRNEEGDLKKRILENREKEEKLSVKKERRRRILESELRLGYGDISFESDNLEDTAKRICNAYGNRFGSRKTIDLQGSLQESFHQNKGDLLDYQIAIRPLFEELEEEEDSRDAVRAKRIDITAKYRGTELKFKELIQKMNEDAQNLERLLSDRDRELFEDILANTISKKIRGKIHASRRWVEKMNTLMESMQTSSGLKLSLRWKSRRAETEEQLDTNALVELLQKDAEIMRPEEAERLSNHFRSKISEARRISGETGEVQSFHAVMRQVLDYRQWFEFQLECQKTGEKKKELTDRVFFTFSGGEKAMAMYVPLFSAVVAKYAGARPEAPRLISLDEAFAGVDETNIRDMFRLMVEFDFDFMINSQILWGDYDTVPGLAIYQLIRPENAKYVSVIRYIWNGKTKEMVTR